MIKVIQLILLVTTLFSTGAYAQEVYKTEVIVGIGITIEKQADSAVQIMGLIPNAPAERAGLVVGDVILQVKSLPTSTPVSVLDLPLTDVVALIRGPVGVPVEILLKRSNGDESVVSIVREQFEIPDDLSEQKINVNGFRKSMRNPS